jgi:predicted TIM-barrel fold metal-dependent hydrolase
MHRRTFLASAAGVAVVAIADAGFGAQIAPFKLYDTHTHFYSSDADKYPFKPDVSPAAKARALSTPITPDYLFKLWDDNGVAMGCGVQYNTTYYTDNRYLLDVAAKYPKRIVPIVILAPTDPATPGMLARMAHDNHIAGVRFAGMPDASGNFSFLTPAADPAWEAADRLGLVVVLMPQKSGDKSALPAAMKRIGEIAARYPNVRIVLDHVGFPEPVVGPTFGLSPEHLALAAHKNVFYKYTTFLIDQLKAGGVPANDFLNYAVGVYGADHFVWGSDVGNTKGDYADFVKVALDSAATLSLAQRKAIFHDTAARLFVPGGRGPVHG